LIALVGLENIMVVDTPDALLVANRSHVQNVKDIYNSLKQQNHDAHKLHQTVYRPWGNYTVLEEGAEYKIKRIEVKPGAKLSLQMHKHRSEHWVVISGEATIANNGIEYKLQENQSTYIPKTHQHRLANQGEKLLQIIEVQCGDYVGEDDIIRIDDSYGRVKPE
jgi:mannose-1-phosphate guanylyltransferase / mannose-6-phosphate isomerase